MTAPLPAKVVLRVAEDHGPDALLWLAAFVDQAMTDGVKIVAVAGSDSPRIHDIIDELVVGDGTADRFILTSWHVDEADALDLLAALDKDEFPGQSRIIDLPA